MNVSVKEAAHILCGSEAWVRSLCKRGIIGDAWSGKDNPERMRYQIVPGRLAEYMKVSEEDIERWVTRHRDRERLEKERKNGNCKPNL